MKTIFTSIAGIFCMLFLCFSINAQTVTLTEGFETGLPSFAPSGKTSKYFIK